MSKRTRVDSVSGITLKWIEDQMASFPDKTHHAENTPEFQEFMKKESFVALTYWAYNNDTHTFSVYRHPDVPYFATDDDNYGKFLYSDSRDDVIDTIMNADNAQELCDALEELEKWNVGAEIANVLEQLVTDAMHGKEHMDEDDKVTRSLLKRIKMKNYEPIIS